MFKKLHQRVKKAYDKKISGTGLAMFRIAYSVIMLCEILQIFYFRHLIFDKIPYISLSEIDFSVPLIIWFISVVFVLIGFKTRISAIISYLFTIALIGTITTYEYHMFYAYVGINFLLIFLPISRCYSIDRILLKLKYSTRTKEFVPSTKVSSLAYQIPLFIAVGFVYADSMFYKLVSPIWMGGLGMWSPANFPMFTNTDASWIMNYKWIALTLGYLTVLFEGVFIFLFWFKKWRLPLFIIGAGLHLGIFMVFPIPWFGLGVFAILLLLMPLKFWSTFGDIFKKGKTKLSVYFDQECPLCRSTKLIVESLDMFGKISFLSVQDHASKDKALTNYSENDLLLNIHSVDNKGKVRTGIDTYSQIFKNIWFLSPLWLFIKLPPFKQIAGGVYNYVAANRTNERCTDESCMMVTTNNYVQNTNKLIFRNLSVQDAKVLLITMGFVVSVLMQMNVSYSSDLPKIIREKISFSDSKVDKIISRVTYLSNMVTKRFFGITNHGVFIDSHFRGYNNAVAIVYKGKDGEVWLPVTDQNGQPDWYVSGFNWVKYTFRINARHIRHEQISKGVRDLTAFWAHKNNISLDNATFLVKAKKIDSPYEWEKNFFDKQIAKPWLDAGMVEWNDKEFKSSIKDIENL